MRERGGWGGGLWLGCVWVRSLSPKQRKRSRKNMLSSHGPVVLQHYHGCGQWKKNFRYYELPHCSVVQMCIFFVDETKLLLLHVI